MRYPVAFKFLRAGQVWMKGGVALKITSMRLDHCMAKAHPDVGAEAFRVEDDWFSYANLIDHGWEDDKNRENRRR